jgi:hypothetical protein
MGYAEWKSGNHDRAEKLMKSGTMSIEAQLGWGHPTYIAAMTQYESFLEEAGQFTAAAEVRTKLARIQSLAAGGAPGSLHQQQRCRGCAASMIVGCAGLVLLQQRAAG